MNKQRYTHKMFDAVCMHVDEHPGCTARDVGNNVYHEFHPASLQVPHLRMAGRIRDWARGLLQILEKDGDIRTERSGRVVRYHLVYEEESP